MSRQFIAIAPRGLDQNQELKQLLGKLKRTMRDRGQDVRWTPPDLWHITLQFVGELSEERSAGLKNILETWAPDVSGLRLRLQGLGAFPSPVEARVLWVGVKEDQELLALQNQLAERIEDAGFAPDEKEFQPHLTLARFRNQISVTELLKLGGRKHFGDYGVDELILFQSVVQGNIIKYVPLMRKSLVQ